MATCIYCDACGAKLPADARFCDGCGRALQAAPEAVPGRPALAAASAPISRSAARSASRAWLVMFGAVLLLLAGVTLLYQQRVDSSDPSPIAPEVALPTTALPAPPPALTRIEIEGLKAAVTAANRAHVDAIFASADSVDAAQIALNTAIGELAQGLYRFHVEAGNGSLEQARAEMRAFLTSLDDRGLGLSEPIIDQGVADVRP
jgi:hypothetical protein